LLADGLPLPRELVDSLLSDGFGLKCLRGNMVALPAQGLIDWIHSQVNSVTPASRKNDYA
jgi:hypothetical protein